MTKQQELFESIFPGEKKPGGEPKKTQLKEDNYPKEKKKQNRGEDTEPQTGGEDPREKETQTQQQQHNQNLGEKKQRRQGINCFVEQLIKPQRGVHRDPSVVEAQKPNGPQGGPQNPPRRETGKQSSRPAEV